MMRYDVAIVGAGVCGLTAAIELSQRDFKVLVLEGAATSGGRVRSAATEDGQLIDEGAHWFHGGDDNVFYRWAKERYQMGPLSLDTVDHQGVMRWKKGDAAAFDSAMERMEKAFEDHGSAMTHASLYDIARLADATDIAEFMARGWMAADDARQISAQDFFADPLGPGGWQMERGVQSVTDAMEAEARRNGVEFVFGAIVQSVSECENGVKIATADGRVFDAAKCLVTVSVGVLKSGRISFGSGVQAAIEEKTAFLEMGNLAKAILPVKAGLFEKSGIPCDLPFYMVDDCIFIHARSGGSDTVTLFRGGSDGCALEAMSHVEAERYVADVFSGIPELSSCFEGRAAPVFRTGWHSNPLTLGSYAYCKPGGQRSDPFHAGGIYFAGEAFVGNADDSAGQMVGAYNSALKAVQALGLSR